VNSRANNIVLYWEYLQQVADAEDAIAGRLRLGSGDAELLADQPVEQHGLADVWPANDRNHPTALH